MTNAQQEVIDIVNGLVRVKVAPSPIHGVGVFALRNIAKGTKMYMTIFPQAFKIPFGSFGKLYPEVKHLIMERWPRVVNNEGFMYPDTLLQAYINHNDTPNYDAINDVTLCDILGGEELTEDYRTNEGWEKAFPWLV